MNTTGDSFGALLTAAKAQDTVAFAKLLTWIDRQGPKALEKDELLNTKNLAFRIGITGPPGAGKSTLVSGLIRYFRQQNLRVGVLAVDPSSPISQGAILGDRIRYSEHFTDEKVFIRSIGTRGSLGGLSGSAYLMLRAFDACEFDVVLVETVGVGQTELDVMYVADLVSVVLVPESGDSIQAMKAGLMEIADVFVVNKSDRPGADQLIREIEMASQLLNEKEKAEVHRVSALKDEGVDALAERFLDLKTKPDWIKKRTSNSRLAHEAKALLRGIWEEKLKLETAKISTSAELKNRILKEI